MSTRHERKDAAFLRLTELLALLEAGQEKIPGFAFKAYPELQQLRVKATEARKALNTWLMEG